MSTALVSVVVPMFNGGATIEACLASLRSQEFQGWEAVVGDDGSTDDGPARVRAVRDFLTAEPGKGV